MSARDRWLLALLTVTWGINWPIMKMGVTELPPMTFRTICMGAGLPVMWLLVRSRGVSLRVPRQDWPELCVLAMTNLVVWVVLVTYALRMLASGRAAILGYTMPIWVAVIGIVVFGDRPSRRLAIGVAAAALGVAFLLAGEIAAIAGSPSGTLLMLCAAIVWGYGTHRMRRRRQATNVLTVTFWSLALALAVCALLSLLFETAQWRDRPGAAGWFAIGYNALVIFGFSQVLWFRLASSLPPVASGLSVMMIPVIGLFSGMAFLGESPRWQDWVALGCILAAIGTVLLPVRPPPRGAGV